MGDNVDKLSCAVFSLLIGFSVSIFVSSLLLPFLKKKHCKQFLSEYLEERHKNKKNTPTMGGLIFVISTMLVLFLFLLFHKMDFSYNLFIVLFTFLGYFLIGFIDDLLIIIRGNNKGLSENSKLFLQTLIALTFFYFFMKAGNEPLLWIHAIHLKLNIGFFYGLFILFVLVASSNAVNITDGLDGLAGGLSFIAFLAFGVITYYTGWLDGYEEIAMFCFILAGSILGFLLFNVNPAKIFMGDTGSLALGATLGTIAILTRHEILLILIGIVFVLETVTCLIQRYYYKLTKKRVFPMTPIHHTFELKGWKETDIVRLFWVIGLLASLLALIYGIWL